MPASSMPRRDALRLGALAAAGLALGPISPAAARERRRLEPITRAIPSTGERLPVIGLGTNQYSLDTAEEMAELQEVLETMVELGGSVIDTARVYGRAEEVTSTGRTSSCPPSSGRRRRAASATSA